jgi:uncharacterized tellurite resistance protein B-like protein
MIIKISKKTNEKINEAIDFLSFAIFAKHALMAEAARIDLLAICNELAEAGAIQPNEINLVFDHLCAEAQKRNRH